MSGVIGGTSHHSGIADLGEVFDPTSWMVKKAGAPEWMNPHTFIKPGTEFLNEQLSKVVKPVVRFERKINPVSNWAHDNIGVVKALDETVENRPVDAMGIAAALFFSGGALAGAGGAGGTGAAGTAGAGGAATGTTSGLLASGAGNGAGATIGSSTLSATTPTIGSFMGGTGIGSSTLTTAAPAIGKFVGGSTLGSSTTMSAAPASTSLFNLGNVQKAVKLGNFVNNQLNQSTPSQSFNFSTPERSQKRMEPIAVTNQQKTTQPLTEEERNKLFQQLLIQTYMKR